MRQKRLWSMLVMLSMLLSLLPGMPAVAESAPVRFERVTSAEEISSNLRYLIVGCPGGFETDTAEYITMGDYEYSSVELAGGYRSALPLITNTDGTLSYDEGTYTPLMVRFSAYGEGQYRLVTESNTYLNGAYATGSITYNYNVFSSKSLPTVNILASHISKWQPIFRSDGTVLFKTSRNAGTAQETSGYIRVHHQANNGGVAVFSGGMLDDSFIDLPDDGSLTCSNLTEETIPVKTYLYKEVCTHSADNVTHTSARESTCSAQGNIEYYYCSYCDTYFGADQTTIIDPESIALPLAPHTNTLFVPAVEPTCTEHGHIAYTKCEDCGGLFEGDATDIPLSESDTVLVAVNHSYVDGVCRYCGKTVETALFNRSGTTGNGSRTIFAAEYNSRFYAMGEQTKKGFAAVEVTEAASGKLVASSETVPFAQTVSCGSLIYVKIGENFLTNNALLLTFVSDTDTATGWSTRWGYDNSGAYGSYLADASNSNAQICLVTDDGDPYFSMCEAVDETHLAAWSYGEACSHPGLEHVAEKTPTCTRDGNREYWYCCVCGGYFSDKDCLNGMDSSEIPLLAAGAKDSDDDGVCDLCGKPMPVYTKVTKADEIVMGNTYILVAELDGYPYVLKMPEADGSGYDYDLGIEMTAGRITAEEDGSFQFNSASRRGAIMMKLGFACDCSDLDQGTVRHELRTTAGNRSLALESYGGFCLTEYAKYGWRIALNEDGSAKLSDVYEESLEDWNAGSGKLCVYRRTEEGGDTSVFFSVSEKTEHTTEKTLTITKHPVYLYRLTETGTVNATTYRLNERKSTVSQDIPLPSEAAVNISNVSGVSQALTQQAIESFITQASAGEAVRLNVDVNITAKSFTEADKETGTGASITYTISPQIQVSTDSNPSGILYSVPDSAFDGSPMSVTLYTGGIEPRQIIHLKEDGTKEYFYPEWSEEVTQKGEQGFTQSWDANGNSYVTLTVTEFSEIKLLDTLEVTNFSLSDYDEKAGTVTVSCASDGTYTLIWANYEKEQLTNLTVTGVKLSEGTNPVEIPKEVKLSYGDRIFLWESLFSARPLCQELTVQ